MVNFYPLDQLTKPLKAELLKVFEEVIDSGQFILGPRLFKFEKEFAKFCGTKHCIGVSSGLDALHLSLRALGVGQGDEVIVPGLTFIATAQAVSMTGATPVPAEIDADTYTLDPDKLAINFKTKAIIPVHLYGTPCDMERINGRGVPVLEDNAQAQGAHHGYIPGAMTGGLSEIAATSFYPAKNLGALGDGGAITTNDEELYKKILKMRNYGSTEKYVHDSVGFNNRLDELQAAFLSIKLPLLRGWVFERNIVATIYLEELNGVGDIKLPYIPQWAWPAWHQFVIRTDHRDELQTYLKEQGIETMIHYPTPWYKQAQYKMDCELIITEEVCRTCLSLPIHPDINCQDEVIRKVKEFYERGHYRGRRNCRDRL